MKDTTTVPDANTAAPDCTTAGCNFGTPFPIPAPSVPAISACVVHKWGQPASGNLDLATGAASLNFSLASDVYLTGIALCPKCSTNGSPGAPGSGTCLGGERNGQPCTSTNAEGLTRDCLPSSNTLIGTVLLNLSPTTGTDVATAATGQFCAGQTSADAGCFGSRECRTITEHGVPAGALAAAAPKAVTLASTFCVPGTGSGVDDSSGLPGPGAVSLPGTFAVH